MSSHIEHVLSEDGLGIGNAHLMGPFVRHGQQTSDATRDRILGQLWIGEPTELLQAGLLVVDAQTTGLHQVVGNVVAQDLEGPLDACAGCNGRPR